MPGGFAIDGGLSAVGTANLDNRSFRLNFETMVLVWNTGFAEKIEAMLEDDFTQSVELTTALVEQPLWIRLGAPFARLLAPLL